MKNFHELVPDMAHKVIRSLTQLLLKLCYADRLPLHNSTRSSWIISKRKRSTTWRWAIRCSWLPIPPPVKLLSPSMRSHWLASTCQGEPSYVFTQIVRLTRLMVWLDEQGNLYVTDQGTFKPEIQGFQADLRFERCRDSDWRCPNQP